MNIELIAQMCHEVNRAWCAINNDSTQKSWSEAEQWQRDSAIKGVQFALDNPNATPESQHEAWYKDKEKDGWMFGFVKDPVRKEHPCMLPYNMLPKEQQIKDKLFRAVVNILK